MTTTPQSLHHGEPARPAIAQTATRKRRPALLIEQQLGHRTHGLNLQRAANEGERDLAIVDVGPGRWTRIPWAVRGSIEAAWRTVRMRPRPSVVFVHTQTIGLLFPLLRLTGQRYVVSVDATPLQYDRMGGWYKHKNGPRVVEALKSKLWGVVFRRASRVVCWSDWAADSVVQDYGVPRERIVVAHPGAPAELFAIERSAGADERPCIVFVGGDFERKGGQHLLNAFAPLADRAELVIMTEADIEAPAGVRIERGVRPGTERFRDLYSRATIFCLPTLGDCTPVAIGEGLAAGLPVVTTGVGSNASTVRHGETGFVISPGDEGALRDALTKLIDSPELCRAMGTAARADAVQRFDAGKNAGVIFDLLEEVAR